MFTSVTLTLGLFLLFLYGKLLIITSRRSVTKGVSKAVDNIHYYFVDSFVNPFLDDFISKIFLIRHELRVHLLALQPEMIRSFNIAFGYAMMFTTLNIT